MRNIQSIKSMSLVCRDDKVVKWIVASVIVCVPGKKRGDKISEEIPDVDPSPLAHADSPKNSLFQSWRACVSESSWLLYPHHRKIPSDNGTQSRDYRSLTQTPVKETHGKVVQRRRANKMNIWNHFHPLTSSQFTTYSNFRRLYSEITLRVHTHTQLSVNDFWLN